MIDPSDDAAWARPATALECAHFDNIMSQKANKASEQARMLFGECLLKLIQLGMKQPQARSMLGKWRGQLKDDGRLISLVNKAHDIATPDPVSYITKAIKGGQDRAAKTVALQKSSWTCLGWEAPRIVEGKVHYKGPVRGQVWRDPFGKEKIMPAKPGVVPPTHEQDPGYSPQKVNKAA